MKLEFFIINIQGRPGGPVPAGFSGLIRDTLEQWLVVVDFYREVFALWPNNLATPMNPLWVQQEICWV